MKAQWWNRYRSRLKYKKRKKEKEKQEMEYVRRGVNTIFFGNVHNFRLFFSFFFFRFLLQRSLFKISDWVGSFRYVCVYHALISPLRYIFNGSYWHYSLQCIIIYRKYQTCSFVLKQKKRKKEIKSFFPLFHFWIEWIKLLENNPVK